MVGSWEMPAELNGGKNDSLLDTLLRTGNNEGQEIKRHCIPTPGYTSE
jgi:hypothetical protein